MPNEVESNERISKIIIKETNSNKINSDRTILKTFYLKVDSFYKFHNYQFQTHSLFLKFV